MTQISDKQIQDITAYEDAVGIDPITKPLVEHLEDIYDELGDKASGEALGNLQDRVSSVENNYLPKSSAYTITDGYVIPSGFDPREYQPEDYPYIFTGVGDANMAEFKVTYTMGGISMYADTDVKYVPSSSKIINVNLGSNDSCSFAVQKRPDNTIHIVGFTPASSSSIEVSGISITSLAKVEVTNDFELAVKAIMDGLEA